MTPHLNRLIEMVQMSGHSIWLQWEEKLVNNQLSSNTSSYLEWGGRMVRKCWENFQYRDVLLIWIILGQGPIALAVGAGGGGVVWILFLSSIISPLSPSLWETALYRLKYCLKGPLKPK